MMVFSGYTNWSAVSIPRGSSSFEFSKGLANWSPYWLLPKVPSKYITLIYSPTNSTKGFLFLAPLLSLSSNGYYDLKVNVNPIGENDISLFIFGISFILNDIIHLFKCLLSIDISLYIDCLFVAFFSLFYLIIFFLLIPKTLCLLRKVGLYASKYLFAFSLNKNISSSSLRELF